MMKTLEQIIQEFHDQFVAHPEYIQILSHLDYAKGMDCKHNTKVLKKAYAFLDKQCQDMLRVEMAKEKEDK